MASANSTIMSVLITPSVVLTQISSYLSGESYSETVLEGRRTSTIGSQKLLFGTAVFFFIASTHIIRYLFRDRPPPGLKALTGPPSDLPYIGKFRGIDVTKPWHAIKELSDRYNGFFQLTSCGDIHIWIGQLAMAQDLLCKKAAIYSSRPMVPAIPGSDSQGQYLPLLARDNHWRVQRRFAHTVLAQSSKSNYYGYIALEAKRYLYQLLQDPTDHYALTDRFCGRISARLAYGRPDSAAAHCKNASEFLAQLAPSGSVINLMPFLSHLPEWAIPSKKQVRLRREREEKLWRGLMVEAAKDVAQGVAPVSYASTYLQSRRTNKAFRFDDDEAAYAVGMLCTVSIFTIGGSLYGFILAMVLHPEWQLRVREEVDRVVAGNGILELSDSPKLPVLRAAIKECFRWRPVVPLGVPRLLEKDDEYDGYYLPKGAIVHAVELSMARDEAFYPDAETYNPARWLDRKYPSYKEPLTEHPRLMDYHGFGMGHRLCVGIEITEAELLTACGALLWAFELRPYLDENGQPLWPDSNKFTSNLIGGPLPFDFDLRVRDMDKAEMIKSMYEKSVTERGSSL